MAIQAVEAEIRRYEGLLTSETLRDREHIQSLVLSYERAAQRLKEAYLDERRDVSNLPPYESVSKR
ncbi:MAG: hypothetical protein ACRDHF_13255 [Tepidiformaceae bacterium]